jgi:predicted RNA-binding Zn-ribbon protein involved in translation (DUF1610 family)
MTRHFVGSYAVTLEHVRRFGFDASPIATDPVVCFGCGLDVDFNETDDHGVCPDCRSWEAQCAAEFRDDD